MMEVSVDMPAMHSVAHRGARKFTASCRENDAFAKPFIDACVASDPGRPTGGQGIPGYCWSPSSISHAGLDNSYPFPVNPYSLTSTNWRSPVS